MMSRLTIIPYRKMHKLLANLGFEVMRQKGSHVFYRHPDGRTTSVPSHGGKDLSRGLIRKILQDVNLSPDDYQQQLDKL